MQKVGLILEGGANRGIFTSGVTDCLKKIIYIFLMWFQYLSGHVMQLIMFRNSLGARKIV